MDKTATSSFPPAVGAGLLPAVTTTYAHLIYSLLFLPKKKINKKSIRPNAKQQQQQSKTKQNKTQKDYHHPSGTDTLPLYPNPQGPGRNWP